MAKKKSRKAVTAGSLTREEKDQLENTMINTLSMCGYKVDHLDRLASDVCRKFGLKDAFDAPSAELHEIETWIVGVWPLDELEMQLKFNYERVSELLKELQNMYLLVNRLHTMVAAQFD